MEDENKDIYRKIKFKHYAKISRDLEAEAPQRQEDQPVSSTSGTDQDNLVAPQVKDDSEVPLKRQRTDDDTACCLVTQSDDGLDAGQAVTQSDNGQRDGGAVSTSDAERQESVEVTQSDVGPHRHGTGDVAPTEAGSELDGLPINSNLHPGGFCLSIKSDDASTDSRELTSPTLLLRKFVENKAITNLVPCGLKVGSTGVMSNMVPFFNCNTTNDFKMCYKANGVPRNGTKEVPGLGVNEFIRLYSNKSTDPSENAKYSNYNTQQGEASIETGESSEVIGQVQGANKTFLSLYMKSSSSEEVCVVCEDKATGLHYGTLTCEGCKGFFKRSIQRRRLYKCHGKGNCDVRKLKRNNCQYCRFKKCLQTGMVAEAVRENHMPGGRTSAEIYQRAANQTESPNELSDDQSGIKNEDAPRNPASNARNENTGSHRPPEGRDSYPADQLPVSSSFLPVSAFIRGRGRGRGRTRQTQPLAPQGNPLLPQGATYVRTRFFAPGYPPVSKLGTFDGAGAPGQMYSQMQLPPSQVSQPNYEFDMSPAVNQPLYCMPPNMPRPGVPLGTRFFVPPNTPVRFVVPPGYGTVPFLPFPHPSSAFRSAKVDEQSVRTPCAVEERDLGPSQTTVNIPQQQPKPPQVYRDNSPAPSCAGSSSSSQSNCTELPNAESNKPAVVSVPKTAQLVDLQTMKKILTSKIDSKFCIMEMEKTALTSMYYWCKTNGRRDKCSNAFDNWFAVTLVYFVGEFLTESTTMFLPQPDWPIFYVELQARASKRFQMYPFLADGKAEYTKDDSILKDIATLSFACCKLARKFSEQDFLSKILYVLSIVRDPGQITMDQIENDADIRRCNDIVREIGAAVTPPYKKVFGLFNHLQVVTKKLYDKQFLARVVFISLSSH